MSSPSSSTMHPAYFQTQFRARSLPDALQWPGEFCIITACARTGEYKGLYDQLMRQGFDFIWITDGQGWLTAEKPLQDTFLHTNHVLNLHMVSSGILDDILCS